MTHTPSRYRWDCPYNWLAQAALKWDEGRLYAELLRLARTIDSDTLHDEYQDEMEQDGYFEPDDDPNDTQEKGTP
jgi:hypothetical protein